MGLTIDGSTQNSVVHKFYPTENDLRTTKTASSLRIGRQTKMLTTSVNYQYHCPVAGCYYDKNSKRHFTCMKYIKQHYKKVHELKTLPCEGCGKRFVDSAALDAHKRVCGERYTCSCMAYFRSRNALLTHVRRKEHTLPTEYALPMRNNPSSENDKSELPHSSNVVKAAISSSVAPTLVVVVKNVEAFGSSLNRSEDRQHHPHFILPKPAIINAAAWLQASAGQPSKKMSTVSVQTENANGPLSKRMPARAKSKSAKAGNSTIHSSGAVALVRRRQQQPRRVVVCDRNTQTTTSSFFSSSMATQTLPPAGYDILLPQPASAPSLLSVYASPEWPIATLSSVGGSGGVDSCHPILSNHKVCQTIDDLGLDVNLPHHQFNQLPASSTGTQTSPRNSARRLMDLDDSGPSLVPYLSDYASVLSSETQTDVCDWRNCLGSLLDDDGDGILYSNIETQTTARSLECLPAAAYDPLLLSHMETQTSDPFLFSDPGNLCNTQTQTVTYGQSGGCCPDVVDMHTQTSQLLHESVGQAQQSHMETQTLLSLFDGSDTYLTDSHTQTPGALLDPSLETALLL